MVRILKNFILPKPANSNLERPISLHTGDYVWMWVKRDWIKRYGKKDWEKHFRIRSKENDEL